MTQPVVVQPVSADDELAISDLHARVFGPGRFTRTAYRVREGTGFASPHCLKAMLNGELAAAIRFTQITIGGQGGALLLGPLAVEPSFAGLGYGKQLVGEGVARARAAGLSIVVLVGNMSYYARFGFKPVPPGQISLPGPVDPARVLAVELVSGALARYAGLAAAC